VIERIVGHAMSERRMVVFTADFSYSVRRGIAEIDAAIPGISWLVVIHSPRRTLRRLIGNQLRNLARNGWRWIPYQAAELLKRLTANHLAATDAHRPGYEFTREALASRACFRIVHVADVHSDSSLATVKAFKPDLGLCIAAPLLHRSLFAIPALGTINLHKGKLPEYRGMPPAFWELWNDEKSIGCSVHWVTEGLDAGGIVGQTKIDRQRFSTLRGLRAQLDEAGIELMQKAVQQILAGVACSQRQAEEGTTYRKPTLAQMAALTRKLAQPRLPLQRRAPQFAKHLVWQGAWLASKCGMNAILLPRITVLLYHRVSDEVRDNLTVGIEQFDRQMSLLRAHCTTLSIEEVVEADPITRDRRPLVAVTFDDGYLDNYQNAAPILLRHCIPAAFFVSTGIVNTERQFPHDKQRGNHGIPVMQWDHLRRMRDWGFTIGSHSVSHIDCAAEPAETVRAELAQSLEHLHRELGIDSALFAYPYGGRQNMTPERLDLVRGAGYAGCLSAYGGTNIGTVDRYNVLRRGIHWEFSDRAFLFECLGLR